MNLTAQELEKLKIMERKRFKKLLLSPLFTTLPFLLVGFIPIKYFPRRWRDTGQNVLQDESLVSFIGLGNFCLFVLVFNILMFWAALTTYRNIGLKKDLKDQQKKVVEGTVNYVGVYEGQHFVRLKKGTGVNILHFDKTNYRPLRIGDKVTFEVYKHSKILINILSNKPKPSQYKMAKIVEVTDHCPACNHKLNIHDDKCPECGLNFS